MNCPRFARVTGTARSRDASRALSAPSWFVFPVGECLRLTARVANSAVILDGFHLKVRMARRVVSVPVLAVLGVAEDGSKRLVALQIAISEVSWRRSSLIADLQKRGLCAPCLVVSDGHAGLRKAIENWRDIKIHRYT